MVASRAARSNLAPTIKHQSSQGGVELCLDDEVAIDLKKQKHVEQGSNSDGVYFLNTHASSTHTIFPRHGRDSAQSLRNFLEKHLPSRLITDEYGCITPIAQVSDDYLPSLQAKMWRSKCDSYAVNLPCLVDSKSEMLGFGTFDQLQLKPQLPVVRKTSELKDAMLLASHAVAIAELLDANHVFILCEQPVTYCEMPTCRMRFDTRFSSSPAVTIEPLVHWGTVTAVTDLRVCLDTIQTFRRTGEMCKDSQWTLAIEKFTSERPTTYCIECLDMLVNKRVEAWAAVVRTKRPVFRAINSCLKSMFPAGRRQYDEDMTKTKDERLSKYIAGVSQKAVDEKRGEPPRDCVGDEVVMAYLCLDGACDQTSSLSRHSHHSTTSTDTPNTTITGNTNNNLQPLTERPSPGASSGQSFTDTSPHGQGSPRHFPPMSIGFNPSTEPKDISSLARAGYMPPSPSSSSIKRSVNTLGAQNSLRSKGSARAKENLNTTGPSRYTNDFERIKDSNSLYQHKKRKFGQELDANAVVAPRKDSSIADTEMKVSKTDFNRITDLRKPFSAPTEPLLGIGEQIAQLSKGQPATATSAVHLSARSSTSSSTSPETISIVEFKASGKLEACKPKTKANTKPLSRKTKSPTKKPITKTKDATPQLLFTPFFAKRPSIDLTSIPDTISPQAYLAHHSRAPDPAETICTCHKAALTPTVKLAQCSNTCCVIGWYHYDCLDKSGKISSRHGKLVCQHCRIDAHFKELDIKNGWSVERMVQNESRMPYMGQDMVDAMPGLGGGFGVVNPYGLGDVFEMSTPVIKPPSGALGEGGFFGYVPSRPFLVNEAYVNGTAHLYLKMPAGSAGVEFEEEEEEEEEVGSWDGYDEEDQGAFDEESEEMETVVEVADVTEDMDVN